jgi:mannobiose 2-epimerase
VAPERPVVNPNDTLLGLDLEMHSELSGRILPYWAERAVDREAGGFFGYIGPDGKPDPAAPRASVLNSRILWTFSAAYRALQDPSLAVLARRAADVIGGQFADETHAGVYWTVDRSGQPVDDRKHIYAQAFAIYGLAEHFRATGWGASLLNAQALWLLVEACANDPEHGGYREAFTRDWQPLEDVRLGETDLNAPRSANTHLHLLEAYTNLYRAWRDPVLRERLRLLVELFLDRIMDPASGHLRLFFDECWTPRSQGVSYGHDIEASWLLTEAAAALGDEALTARATAASLLTAESVLREGLDPSGGVFFSTDGAGQVDTGKEWWTQAEAVVGFLNAYQKSQRLDFLEAARAPGSSSGPTC